MMVGSWVNQAVCRLDPELWFPDGYATIADRLQAEEAKTLCLTCPVMPQCLAHAMEREAGNPAYLRHGVWGGKTPQEREDADPTARKVSYPSRRRKEVPA